MPIVLDRQTLLRETLHLAQLCDEFPSWDLEPFSEFLSFGDRQVMLGLSKTEHDGDVWSCYCVYQPVGNSTRILSFGTHPRFRNRGLARSIIDQLDEHDKRVVAYVPRENTDAAAFLLAIGFEQAGELIEGFNERIRFARQPRNG